MQIVEQLVLLDILPKIGSNNRSEREYTAWVYFIVRHPGDNG